ncbi:DUF1538 domain-containing protein [Oceanotoga sp. DSM 15011]|uniref:Uncharacterized protein DUF1538 n=1 Tax=Oceanotoga teriensis TaxID=515440 RepID=A0AA45C5W2_9BACT|nr:MULTISPECIES: DUF1538 domain-containing protein [Oceanotoga]MDN5343266.1 hypothetical protein [Oceanotoga sp.]PWJ89651.1 uncharacterized protein DUF1538 [Oceanotoga teriensis]UYO98921.1 DUF1538 domain-containing protein [Oceanotoga sp. DSM 15011]
MKVLDFLKDFFVSFKELLPLLIFLLIFQIFVFKKPVENLKDFFGGLIFTTLGLMLFMKGISTLFLPLSKSFGENIIFLDNKILIIFFTSLLAYFSTLIEPGLKVVAAEVEEASIGAINAKVLIQFVAFGVALGMAFGIIKILFSLNIRFFILPILLIISILILFTKKEFIGIAFDAASSTTGPVNIPVNMAIGLGISKMVQSADPLMDGFGIVGLMTLGPVISVLILGLFYL